MNTFTILSCNNNLGNCCQSSELASLFKVLNTFIVMIQVIVPIILLVMLSINFGQLVMNPDDKKKSKEIRNKLVAACIVFLLPLLVNLSLNMMSVGTGKSFNFMSCLQESKNIKVSSGGKYISKKEEDNKDITKIYTDSSSYHGKVDKSTTSTSPGSYGQSITPGEAVVGDSGVKLVPNDSHRTARIVRKGNGAEVAAYAQSWLGKGLTYKLGSTSELTPGGTCDCSHFVYKVLSHFGIIEGGQIRTTVWGSGNVKGTILYSDVSHLVPGDVVFKYFGNATAHVEIYIGNNETIGCNSGKGVTHGHRASNYDTFIHLTAYD